jgi:hypothetical protein
VDPDTDPQDCLLLPPLPTRLQLSAFPFTFRHKYPPPPPIKVGTKAGGRRDLVTVTCSVQGLILDRLLAPSPGKIQTFSNESTRARGGGNNTSCWYFYLPLVAPPWHNLPSGPAFAACILAEREWGHIKGTVSPDYKCLEVISIKSPLLGDVTPDI